MAAGKALTTMVIGSDYRSMWDGLYRKSVEAYAQRHDYELVVIDANIDPRRSAMERHPRWQKCLILEHPRLRDREHVAWIDADVFANYRSGPCVVEHYRATDGGRGGIGAVPFGAIFTTAEALENRWHRAHRDDGGTFRHEPGRAPPQRYAGAGLPTDQGDVVDTGVLVLRPDLHTGFLRRVYETGAGTPHPGEARMWLSYRILEAGLLSPLDPRFNKVWSEEVVQHYPFLLNAAMRQQLPIIALCVTAAWLNGYFLHFRTDRLTRGDARYIMTMFDDPARISLEALLQGKPTS